MMKDTLGFELGITEVLNTDTTILTSFEQVIPVSMHCLTVLTELCTLHTIDVYKERAPQLPTLTLPHPKQEVNQWYQVSFLIVLLLPGCWVISHALSQEFSLRILPRFYP